MFCCAGSTESPKSPASRLILVPIQGTLCWLIQTFRNGGLKRFFLQGDPSKIRADQVRRIADVLAHLDRANHPSDVDLPGYRLHPLKGRWKGVWSVWLSGNWRIVFRFEDGGAFDVDLVDYH